MALNLFFGDCKIMLESIPGTNQYLSMRVNFLTERKQHGDFDGV